MTGQISEWKAVVERLERLERQNRTLRRGGVAALALAGAAVLMGQATPAGQTVEAEGFILRGPNGKARAELAMRGGEPRLILRDANEKEQVRLAVSADGSPTLTFYYNDWRPNLMLKAGGVGPALTFFDKEGKTGAVLGVYSDGSPSLAFMDRAQKTRAILGILADGSPALAFQDKAGARRTALGVLPDGSPALTFADTGGRIIRKMP
ncbi:MAG TPA: hypothetical protein VIG69_00225 [Candidatus Methylomirabilis sp.]